MIKNIRNEIKQSSSIQTKIRKARFVQIEPEKTKMFKLQGLRNLISKKNKHFINVNRKVNSVIQKTQLLLRRVNWVKVKYDSIIWIIGAGIEGFTFNFATHYLFGTQFDLMTVFAHGIIIKQGLSVYWRLRRNGSGTRLLTKNK